MLNLLMLPSAEFRVTDAGSVTESGVSRRTHTFSVEWIATADGIPTKEYRPPLCPFCGHENLHRDGKTASALIVDAPAFDTYVRWRLSHLPVFRCQKCRKRTTLAPEEIDLDRRMTKRCIDYIDRLAALRPFAHVADEIGIAPYKAAEIAKGIWKVRDAKPFGFAIPRYLGIDEISLNQPGDKRRNAPLRTVFTDLDSGQVLDILNDASRESVVKWLTELKAEVKRRREMDPDIVEKPWIRAIVSDMRESYEQAASAVMPGVPFIVDRFHVHQLLRKAFRPLVEGKKHKPNVRKIDTEIDRLDGIEHDDASDQRDLLQSADPVREAFEKFSRIYATATDSINAAAEMEWWATRLPPHIQRHLNGFVHTLRSTPGLLDYFNTRVTNAKAEAANGIVRVTYQTNQDVYATDRELRNRLGGLDLLREKMRARARHRPATEFYCDGCFRLKPLKQKRLSATRMYVGTDLAEDTFDDEPFWLCVPCFEKAKSAERCEGFPLGRKWPSDGSSFSLDGDEAEDAGSYELLAWARFNLTLPGKLRYDLTPTRDQGELPSFPPNA